MKKEVIYVLLLALFLTGCYECNLLDDSVGVSPTVTRAVPTVDFDWENADWMPTPAGQSRIPTPWVGAGSIASVHGMEIMNDRYRIDGWELLYSSFDSNAPGPLVNPYFILYNKYRGILRVYSYITTQFVTASSYLQDGIEVISSYQTSLLSFLGHDVVHADAVPSMQYHQIQPAPFDGTSPLAANKWYMSQYELAYDPELSSIPYNQIQLAWYLNYCNVQKVSLGGGIEGSINGTIGASGSSNVISSLKQLGKSTGTGVLAGVGLNFLTQNTVNAETGQNKIGLSNKVFKTLSAGINSALSASCAQLPGAALSVLSAIFGSKNSMPTPINMQIQADISLTGNITEKGSFPSSPFSHWVPGTNIAPNAPGAIPLYNKSLGVVNFEGCPKLNVTKWIKEISQVEDPYDGSMQDYEECYAVCPDVIDFSRYLIVNPDVKSVADVIIRKQDLIAIDAFSTKINPSVWLRYIIDHCCQAGAYPLGPSLAVRFTIEIRPKNGDNSSTIIKTFGIQDEHDYEKFVF